MQKYFQLPEFIVTDGPGDVIFCRLDRLQDAAYLVVDIVERCPVFVEEIVFFRNPHLEERRIQVIGYFHEFQFCEDKVHIIQREDAYQDYESDIEDIGEYDFTFYLHVLLPLGEVASRGLGLLVSHGPVPEDTVKNHEQPCQDNEHVEDCRRADAEIF